MSFSSMFSSEAWAALASCVRCCAGPHLSRCPLSQELAKERFDPDALLAVFRRGRPTWLHALAADPRGRRLILDLSAQHPGSLFLAYALRRIFDTVRSAGLGFKWRSQAARLQAACASGLPSVLLSPCRGTTTRLPLRARRCRRTLRSTTGCWRAAWRLQQSRPAVRSWSSLPQSSQTPARVGSTRTCMRSIC